MMIDIFGDLCALKFDNKPFELQSFSHEFFSFLVQYHRAILFLNLWLNIFAFFCDNRSLLLLLPDIDLSNYDPLFLVLLQL